MAIRTRKIPKSPFRDDQIVVAVTSFCSDEPYIGLLIKKGARLKASDPIVARHSYYFVADGEMLPTDPAVAAQFNSDAVDAAAYAPRDLRPPSQMDDAELAVCVRRLVVDTSDLDGPHTGVIVVEVGEKLARNSDVVLKYGDFFKPADG
jgi:hypothetical protein